MKACEICDNYKAIRRQDNLYVCDKCNEEYPIPDELKEGE